MAVAAKLRPGNALNGPDKAAVLLISVGPDAAAKILRHLSEDEIERMTALIAARPAIDPETRDQVLKEFVELGVAHQYLAQGGRNYARSVLERTFGSQKAQEMLARMGEHIRVRPFDQVRRTDPNHLANYLANEHPQTIAVVVAHLYPDQAAVVLGGLGPDMRSDVMRRAAQLDRTSPELLREVERVLEGKLAAMVDQGSSAAGGMDWAIDVLGRLDRSVERGIMDSLDRDDPYLSEALKQRMFRFEDLEKLDDRTLQRVLREVDMVKDMPLALKVASDQIKKKVVVNISKRAAETLDESIGLLGPVRLRDVEEAQSRIVGVARKLEEAGEIQISYNRGGDEVVI